MQVAVRVWAVFPAVVPSAADVERLVRVVVVKRMNKGVKHAGRLAKKMDIIPRLLDLHHILPASDW